MTPWSDKKPCQDCNRLMSADDAHRLCQQCRPYGGKGKWPSGWSAEYQREYRARKWAQ